MYDDWGIHVEGRYDVDTGEYRIKYSQPRNPVKRVAKRARDKAEQRGIRKDAGLIRTAVIPPVVVIEIMDKYGINPQAPGSQENHRKLAQIIETHYPDLKTVPFRIG